MIPVDRERIPIARKGIPGATEGQDSDLWIVIHVNQ
jgi:hypothetical protein